MKPTTFEFNFQRNNETFRGSAVIVDASAQVREAAEAAFLADGDERSVSINQIGANIVGPDQPGYEGRFAIYEAYTDSGSDDYYYFAVMTDSIEL